MSASADRKLRTTISYLEMAQPPADPAPADPPGLRLERAAGITVAFYRYLYNEVGRQWLWYERRARDDASLAALLHGPSVEVHVAYARGVPAGFFELDRRHPTDIDLAYFGLLPDFIGQGLGHWFLRRAVDAAWAQQPRRLTVNTNSFDHPRALANYRRAGFVLVRQVEHSFDDPRLTGLI
ncbi:MAG: GNAT family N-acetyltransferase [Reyranellaceae bacterium]